MGYWHILPLITKRNENEPRKMVGIIKQEKEEEEEEKDLEFCPSDSLGFFWLLDVEGLASSRAVALWQ